MATPTTATQPAATSLSAAQLNAAYRNMFLSRRMDDKEIQLKRQNKIFFQISGAGHEAILTAAGMVIRSGYDWFGALLPRSRALPAAWHDAGGDAVLGGGCRGRSRIPAAGRCRATGGIKTLNIVSSSSPTGTQFLQAVGIRGSLAAREVARHHRGLHGGRGGVLSPPARGRPAKASSGSRSTPRAISSCRSSIWSRTTGTRSPSRSR